MKIPQITDEMLDRVLAAAALPVFILFEELDSLGYRKNRTAVEAAMAEYDDRIIFVRVLIDEDPWAAIYHGPSEGKAVTYGAVGYVRKKRIAEIAGIFGYDKAAAFAEQLLTHTESFGG